MSFFTPEAVSWFPPFFVGALPAETFSGFTADQISNIQAQFFISNPAIQRQMYSRNKSRRLLLMR